MQFHFAGVVESDGRYPIRMEPVKLESVLEECEETIARRPVGPDIDFDEVCSDGYYHTDECLNRMHYWSQPCIMVGVEKAEQRRNRLLFLSLLKDCARDPARANGLYTLEGLAQESCIYNVRYL